MSHGEAAMAEPLSVALYAMRQVGAVSTAGHGKETTARLGGARDASNEKESHV